MHIKEFWDHLSADTQKWLMDNPGSIIVPRTVTAIINGQTGEDSAVDIHGGTVLTAEDQDFIHAKARRRETQTEGGPKFFDAVGPQD
ncbi:UNVERIFIED_CONTAM: hypothetical protein ABIE34_001555 [Jeotgalibacillus campisalis]